MPIDYFVSYVYQAHTREMGYGQTVSSSPVPLATSAHFKELSSLIVNILAEQGTKNAKVVVLNVQRLPL